VFHTISFPGGSQLIPFPGVSAGTTIEKSFPIAMAMKRLRPPVFSLAFTPLDVLFPV
jgi:hypothetical protein